MDPSIIYTYGLYVYSQQGRDRETERQRQGKRQKNLASELNICQNQSIPPSYADIRCDFEMSTVYIGSFVQKWSVGVDWWVGGWGYECLCIICAGGYSMHAQAHRKICHTACKVCRRHAQLNTVAMSHATMRAEYRMEKMMREENNSSNSTFEEFGQTISFYHIGVHFL